MLSEISQNQNDRYHLFSLISGIQTYMMIIMLLLVIMDMRVKGGLREERKTESTEG
jgi:hypothetical protein